MNCRGHGGSLSFLPFCLYFFKNLFCLFCLFFVVVFIVFFFFFFFFYFCVFFVFFLYFFAFLPFSLFIFLSFCLCAFLPFCLFVFLSPLSYSLSPYLLPNQFLFQSEIFSILPHIFTTNHYHYCHPPPTTFSVPKKNKDKCFERPAKIVMGLLRLGNNLGVGGGAGGGVLTIMF